MTDSNNLGELEHLILLAVLRLEPHAYAVPVVEDIERNTGRTISKAAVYIGLARLERKGLLRSRLADPTPERGGRAKRYFHVQSEAIKLLRESRRGLLKMWVGLDSILGRQ
jgi:PadR family transcriptional regulator, regulatory protein PadR